MRIATLLTVASLIALTACDRPSSYVIPESVSCRACRIVLESTATIGDPSGDGILTGARADASTADSGVELRALRRALAQ